MAARYRPGFWTRLQEDVATALRKDPATTSLGAAILHQGVHAIWAHRFSQALCRHGFERTAQIVAYAARAVTGVEIHPRAKISDRVFIDHGAGVVIGETAVIESEVMLYHNVTVGSVGWWRPREVNGRRHPHICESAVLCTGSLILGPVTVGRGCIVGANAVVLADLADGQRIQPGRVWRGPDDERHGLPSNGEPDYYL